MKVGGRVGEKGRQVQESEIAVASKWEQNYWGNVLRFTGNAEVPFVVVGQRFILMTLCQLGGYSPALLSGSAAGSVDGWVHPMLEYARWAGENKPRIKGIKNQLIKRRHEERRGWWIGRTCGFDALAVLMRSLRKWAGMEKTVHDEKQKTVHDVQLWSLSMRD